MLLEGNTEFPVANQDEPQALRQLERIPKRSHPHHNSRELYHNKRESFIPQIKRSPTLPQLERGPNH